MNDKYEGLPAAVKRQGEEADRKIAEMEAAKQTPAPAETPAEPQPADETPPQPQDPPPEDTPIPAEPPAEPPAPPTPPREDWKQKFLTLQGKYNAEIPRLHDEINGMRALVQEQTRQLTELLRQPQQPAAPPADPNAPPKRRFVSDEDAAALGPELAEQQDRVLSRAIDPLQTEMKTTREAIEQMNKRLFFSDLTELVPNWKGINKLQAFLDWLGEADPMDPSRKRGDVLHAHERRQDAAAVASVFGLFIATHPDVDQPAPPASGPTSPRKEDLVQPPRQRGSPPAVPPKKVWKTSEINQFAKELSRKAWDSRPAEAARIQAEIDQAYRDKRIVIDT